MFFPAIQKYFVVHEDVDSGVEGLGKKALNNVEKGPGFLGRNMVSATGVVPVPTSLYRCLPWEFESSTPPEKEASENSVS